MNIESVFTQISIIAKSCEEYSVICVICFVTINDTICRFCDVYTRSIRVSFCPSILSFGATALFWATLKPLLLSKKTTSDPDAKV